MGLLTSALQKKGWIAPEQKAPAQQQQPSRTGLAIRAASKLFKRKKKPGGITGRADEGLNN